MDLGPGWPQLYAIGRYRVQCQTERNYGQSYLPREVACKGQAFYEYVALRLLHEKSYKLAGVNEVDVTRE
jgi:hypothetical protein